MAAHVLPAAGLRSEAFPAPTPRRRRSRPVELTSYRRERIEGLIEVLLGILDAADEDTDYCPAEDAAIMGIGNHYGCGYPGDPEDGEPCDDDERSLQPAVTPDSTRPTAALPWPWNAL